MFHANVHYHRTMDSLVHAQVMYPLDISLVIIVVTPTNWSEFRVELVKEMVLGLEVTHFVFKVECHVISRNCHNYKMK